MWAENLLLMLFAGLVTAVMVLSWRVSDAARITGQAKWVLFSMSGFVLPLAAMMIAVIHYRSP